MSCSDAHLRIPLRDIEIATNNFAEENLIKRGVIKPCGSSEVYKGLLLRFETTIDVVIWRFRPLLWNIEVNFKLEIDRLPHLNHKNVVTMIGFCDNGDERMIVMEHIVNGSLDKYLGDPTLTWSQRLHICLGAAHAFSYFAHSNRIHGIKSSKIMLGKDWEVKVCCIRMSSAQESDVYSLGWILFEVLSGGKATISDVNQFLAISHQKERLDDMVASFLRKQMHTKSLSRFSNIARMCLKKDSNEEQIVRYLNEALTLQQEHENLVKNLVKNLACWKIPLSDIKLATDDFAISYCVKSHQDDRLYKAELDYKHEGKKPVVIKRIINHKHWTTTNFYAELQMLASCKHDNLVSLLGFCDEDSEMILVFECDFIQTLDDYLGSTSNKTNPTWEQRIRICLDIAHGLKYLHNIQGKQSEGLVHQGILSANITLDEKWTAKIANFRLSKFDSCPTVLSQSILENFISWLGEAHNVVNDIYSIGVILFEILTGRLAYDPFYMADNFNGFASMARQHYDAGTLKDMIDPKIMEEAQNCIYSFKKGPDQYSLDAYSKIAYQCLAETPSKPHRTLKQLHQFYKEIPSEGHLRTLKESHQYFRETPSERPTLEDVIKSFEKALYFQVENFEYMMIPLKDIQLATKGFDKSRLIGSGGYGEVYKAKLKTKSKNELGETLNTVAIKRIFSRKDDQGKEGFLAELNVLTRCKHPNIVALVGFCVEGSEWILVYEHASNGSLNDYLGRTDNMIYLTWAQCLKMCIDIAKGLNYLHTNMEDKRMIVHRDIKSDNILLGKNWEAKIADFGLSKLHPANQHASTINTNNVAGTDFYLDPEYAKTGKLKKASDIYSLGVVLFEIFSGKLANDSSFITENEQGLAPIARIHFEKGTLKELLDSRLIKKAYELGIARKVRPEHDSLDAFSRIAYKCLAKTQRERPTIDVVIEELEKALYIQEKAMQSSLKISLAHIKLSVENFSDDNCIMKGGYGRLYKGKVQYNNGHKEIAVKRFSTSSQKDVFLKEFEVLYRYQQENIISLVGYCKENFEKIIVYEHASRGSLNKYLNNASFSWPQRLKICIDIANGLKFLHGGDVGQDVVIHRDIKSSNILLTEDWKAKICNFELAVTYPANKEIEYLKNDVLGSPGYCDPLYWDTLVLTKESDIYSFGVILFEMLCGRSACPADFKDSSQFLDVLVKRHFQVARLLNEIVFEGIKEQIAPKSLTTFRRIAFQCLHDEIKERPTAGDVAVQLQKALEFQEAYEKREIDSTMAKNDIYNIVSKGLLLEDDKLEIIRVLQATTSNSEQSAHFIGENDDDYHSDYVMSMPTKMKQARWRRRRYMPSTTLN